MLNADIRKGGGVDQMRTPADRGEVPEGVGKGVFFADVLYGRLLK